jgi:hypothetical protein
MTRSFILLVVSLFLGVTSLMAGCGGEAPVDDTAAALSVVSSDDGGAPASADAKRPPVVCGGVVCSPIARCCHGRCFIPREDHYCTDNGGISQ